MTNARWFRCLAPSLCLGLALFDIPPLDAQTPISINPVSSGVKAAVYGGIAAAAGIVVLATYLVLHKPSITGCTRNEANGLGLQTDRENTTYSLIGNTGQLKAGERIRVSGKANKKDHTFAVSKLSKDFGACQAGTALD